MSNTKFTPGPWKIGDTCCQLGPDYREIDADTHSALATVVWKMEDEDRSPIKEAKAHLIATAPELYEMLQAACNHLTWIGYGDSWESECVEAAMLEEKIERALAKARGE